MGVLIRIASLARLGPLRQALLAYDARRRAAHNLPLVRASRKVVADLKPLCIVLYLFGKPKLTPPPSLKAWDRPYWYTK